MARKTARTYLTITELENLNEQKLELIRRVALLEDQLSTLEAHLADSREALREVRKADVLTIRDLEEKLRQATPEAEKVARLEKTRDELRVELWEEHLRAENTLDAVLRSHARITFGKAL